MFSKITFFGWICNLHRYLYASKFLFKFYTLSFKVQRSICNFLSYIIVHWSLFNVLISVKHWLNGYVYRLSLIWNCVSNFLWSSLSLVYKRPKNVSENEIRPIIISLFWEIVKNLTLFFNDFCCCQFVWYCLHENTN